MTQNYIGVDVARNWIDIFEAETGEHRKVETSRSEQQRLAREYMGRIVVFEATGGHERPLMDALGAADEPFVRVTPRQARDFARATGLLARTDKVDARMPARMGSALKVAPSSAPDPDRDRIAGLLRIPERRPKRCEVETAAHIQQHDRLARDHARLQSIPGIGPFRPPS